MGTSYWSISKVVKEVDGKKIAKANLYGKAPSFRSTPEQRRNWDKFEYRANEAAKVAAEREAEFVIEGSFSEVKKFGKVPLSKWNGWGIQSDVSFDKNFVGYLTWETGIFKVVVEDNE